MPLVAPRVMPVLDAAFRPAVLANRHFRSAVQNSNKGQLLRIALEQADGSTFHFSTEIFAKEAFGAPGNFLYVERLVKFLLWGWGGWRIHFDGPRALGEQLAQHFRESATGKFDSELIGEKIFDHPIEVIVTRDLPPARSSRSEEHTSELQPRFGTSCAL